MRRLWQLGLGPLLSLASLLSAVLALGVVGAATDVATAMASPGGPNLEQAVHVVRCKTTWAASGPHPVQAVPSKLRLSLPPAIAGRVDVYVASTGFKLLGPLGWACAASIGNGGFGIWASPTVPTGTAGDEQPQVNETFQGCVGCSLDEACPLFATAAADNRSLYGKQCPKARPAGERVVRLSATAVAFEDPPHVRGDGEPSGGPFPTYAVMTYHSGFKFGYSTMLADCAMPQPNHPLCTAVLNAFLGWYANY